MIIRLESSIGTKRIEVSETDNLSILFNLAREALGLDSCADLLLSKTRNPTDALSSQCRTLIKSSKLKNGDLLYVLSKPKVESPKDNTLRDQAEDKQSFDSIEDEVDALLDTMDGRIIRPRSNFCHHPDSGHCIHCVPLEPSDPNYLSYCDPPVKFMSFHAYLRKLRGNQSKGKFIRLENLDCTVRNDCPDHAAWPEGICTKCQPKPITLDVQTYRHVDYVQFENAEVMQSFLDYWRQTGKQRIGLLLGQYAHFDGAAAPPLAIKAVVSVIYEPPQEATSRSVRITCPLEAMMPPSAKTTAEALGLKVVGWIFTDLTAEGGTNKGTVKHYRGNMETFFMSAQECITAARLQNLHPNAAKDSPDGHFGSKFVTVVVTGGKTNEIHFEGYQVSNVAMALEAADILVPTFDLPELGYIRESTKDRFVPDIFYSSKDKYGNTVTKIGRPLPVEYLLIDMPAAFPKEQTFTFAEQSFFNVSPADLFPIENREDLGQKQSIEAFARHCRAFGRMRVFGCLANFHVLAWLAKEVNHLPLSQSGLDKLLRALREGSAVDKWAASSSEWASLELIVDAVSGGGGTPPHSPMETATNMPRPASFRDVAISGFAAVSTSVGGNSDLEDEESPGGAASAGAKFWVCQHCTLHNALGRSECDACSLPRRS